MGRKTYSDQDKAKAIAHWTLYSEYIKDYPTDTQRNWLKKWRDGEYEHLRPVFDAIIQAESNAIIQQFPEFSSELEQAKVAAVTWIRDCIPTLSFTPENLVTVANSLQVMQNVRIDEALLQNMQDKNKPLQLAIDFGEDEPLDIEATTVDVDIDVLDSEEVI